MIGEIVWPAEMVQTFTRLTGRDAAYVPAYSYKDLAENYPHFDHEFIEETMEMVQYAVEYGHFRGDRDLEWSRHMNPGVLTWKKFLKKPNGKGPKSPTEDRCSPCIFLAVGPGRLPRYFLRQLRTSA